MYVKERPRVEGSTLALVGLVIIIGLLTLQNLLITSRKSALENQVADTQFQLSTIQDTIMVLEELTDDCTQKNKEIKQKLNDLEVLVSQLQKLLDMMEAKIEAI